MYSQLSAPDTSASSDSTRDMSRLSYLRQISQRKWFRVSLASVLLIAATFAVYWPATGASYIWDDDQDVYKNEAVKATNGHGLKDIWFPTSPQRYYYPLTTTTYWVEWKFRADNLAGYHVTNIAMHALASLLLWLVLGTLRLPGAWLAALIFAIHPVNVATVAWITERKNILSLILVLCSLLCYLKSEHRHGKLLYPLSLLIFSAGLLAKTSIVIFPLVLLLISWWQTGHVNRRTAYRIAPFFLLALAGGLMTTWVEHSMAIAEQDVRPEGWASRIAATGWMVWFYASKAILPVQLSPIYPRWNVDPTNAMHWIPLLALLTGLVVLWKSKRPWARPCRFAVGYLIIALLPVLGFISISYMNYSLIADHWQYLAIIGSITLFSATVASAARYLNRHSRTALMSLTACAVVGISVLAHGRCHDYHDIESWGKATLRENKSCHVAHYALALLYQSRGDLTTALEHYETLTHVKPHFETPYVVIGAHLAKQGNHLRALEVYSRGVNMNPESAILRYNCGSFLLANDTEAALQQYLAVLEIDPDHAAAHDKIGAILVFKGKPREAIPHHLKAIAGEPKNSEFHYNLGVSYSNSGQLEKARVALLQALSINANYVEAHAALSKIYAHQGDYLQASKHRRSAMEISGKDTVRR